MQFITLPLKVMCKSLLKLNNNLLGGASIYFAANIINAIISFLLLPLLTRALNPEAFGVIAMFLVVLSSLGAFTGLSVHGAVSVNYFKGNRDYFPQFIGNCFFILIISSIFTGLIINTYSIYLTNLIGLERQWLILAVIISAGQFIINIRLMIWQVRENPIKYGIFQISFSGINACISIFLIILLHWAEAGRIWGIVITILIFAIFSLVTLYKDGLIKLKWDKKLLNEALDWGIPLIPHVIGGLIMVTVDRFIITRQLGLESTGIYFIAIQVAMPIIMIGNSFNNAFRPWLYKKLANGDDALAVIISYVSMVCFLLIGICYAFFIYYIFPYFIGEKYINARWVGVILILSNTFQILYYTVSNYILFDSKTKILSILTIVIGIVYAVGGWFVVIYFGLIGLPYLFGFISVLYFILTWFISASLSPKPWFNWGELAIASGILFESFSWSKKKRLI
jgi:O-antigen/teichoic acid export membrane protein